MVDYKSLIIDLIAYCQRNEVLSTNTETLLNQLEGLFDYTVDRETISEIID